jgi:hypothetical protein
MNNKKPLIGASLCAVILLFLGSLSNVIGYHTFQDSQQNVIIESIDRRELLFPTIVDIVNNKEVQRIIQKSHMRQGLFPESNIPIVTKNQLKQMYILGLLFSRFISPSRMQSMVGKYQLISPEVQQEINSVIEQNPTLDKEMNQLSNSECNCENEDINPRNFLILCKILYYLQAPIVILGYVFFHFPIISLIIDGIIIICWRTAIKLDCEWLYFPTP